MIQANELRIGNWINFVSVPVRFTGTACYGEGAWGLDKKHLMPLIEYNGHEFYQSSWESLQYIPLTPEILERCEFDVEEGNENSNYTHWADNGILQIRFTEDGFTVYHVFGGSRAIIEHIKYIHQIQNFVYATTNQELTINLSGK